MHVLRIRFARVVMAMRNPTVVAAARLCLRLRDQIKNKKKNREMTRRE